MNSGRSRKNLGVGFVVLGLVTIVMFTADILLGSVKIPFSDFISVLKGSSDSDYSTIVKNFRFPKALVSLFVGAALSVSGLQMQTLFRNPLAGPFVLGISSGASLGAALFIMGLPLLGLGAVTESVRNIGIIGSAWLGSAIVLLIILAVSLRLKDIMAVLILGIMFGSAATAFVDILQYLSPESALKSYVIWTMGSVKDVSSSQLTIMLPLLSLGLIMSVFLIKPLNLLLLGENYARTMGMNVTVIRGLLIFSTIVLAGTVTAFCGPIGFVGIAVPHVARMIFRNADHRVLIPASMLIGSSLLLLCDIISQMPGYNIVLPINPITALTGIPIVILVIVRNRKIW